MPQSGTGRRILRAGGLPAAQKHARPQGPPPALRGLPARQLRGPANQRR
ncbi:MAG: hypothetical protein WKG07_16965 [Hymenobacter sp.]